MINLIVRYPQPTDEKKFDADYNKHLELLHEKNGLPKDLNPDTYTTFLSGLGGDPANYQLFTMPFDAPEALGKTMSIPAMQEVAAEANKISSGGQPM